MWKCLRQNVSHPAAARNGHWRPSRVQAVHWGPLGPAAVLVFFAPGAVAVVVGGGAVSTMSLRRAAFIDKARSRHLSAVAAIFAGSGWLTRTAAAYISSKVDMLFVGCVTPVRRRRHNLNFLTLYRHGVLGRTHNRSFWCDTRHVCSVRTRDVDPTDPLIFAEPGSHARRPFNIL